jgi:hypothetical protein
MVESTRPPAPSPPAAITTPHPPSAPAVGRAWSGFDPATRRPTLVVAILIAGLFFGSQILNDAIPANAGDGRDPGSPVAIGSASQITPLGGWSVAELEGGGLRLEKGFVAVDLFQVDVDAGAAELAVSYVDEVLRPVADQLTAGDPAVVADETGSAARLRYAGIFTGANGTIEGELTVVVTGGRAVVADAWAPQGELAIRLDEVHEMLGTLEIGP